MSVLKAELKDGDSLDVDYEVMFDGKYVEIDVKEMRSGDRAIFVRDTGDVIDVFWLFPQYDEGKGVFFDDEKNVKWVDKK